MQNGIGFTQSHEATSGITASSLGVQTAGDYLRAVAEETSIAREEGEKRSSQSEGTVPGMLTLTEKQLHVIAEKIDTIRTLRQRQGVVGNLRIEKNQDIAKELKAIGQIVTLLPQPFTERYSDVPWGEIGEWSSLNIYLIGFTEQQLENMMSVLDKAEMKIKRHADTRSEMHQGIIMALNSTYEKCSVEWYSYITTPYLLVSLSVIMLIIRIALNDIGFTLTGDQMSAYSIHAVILFLVILEIQLAPKRSYALIPSVDNFSTLAEFYDNQFTARAEEIKQIRKILDARRKLRLCTRTLWVITLAASIIVTWIQNLD